MDSCLMDITSLQNVPQKQNHSSINAELNESHKYDSNGNKNQMIYCFWNFFHITTITKRYAPCKLFHNFQVHIFEELNLF
jgi:hypothetical protein